MVDIVFVLLTLHCHTPRPLKTWRVQKLQNAENFIRFFLLFCEFYVIYIWGFCFYFGITRSAEKTTNRSTAELAKWPTQCGISCECASCICRCVCAVKCNTRSSLIGVVHLYTLPISMFVEAFLHSITFAICARTFCETSIG